jgi:hypothetical protein
MSIVHMSQLSQEDLAYLGNNLTPPRRTHTHRSRPDRQLQAVNRSLATLGERVTKLEGPTVNMDCRSRRLSA